MTGTIIPLRSKDEEASALAWIDETAIKLLTGGRATTLSAARIEALLTLLHAQRTELAAVLADLGTRAPSADPQIDRINATLTVQTSQGLAQVDRMIQEAEASVTLIEGGVS